MEDPDFAITSRGFDPGETAGAPQNGTDVTDSGTETVLPRNAKGSRVFLTGARCRCVYLVAKRHVLF